MRRGIDRVLRSFLPLVLLIACATTSAKAYNAVIDEARNSVLRVYVELKGEGGYTGYAMGSAFVVAQSGTNTVLITNRHVVSASWYTVEDEFGVEDRVYFEPQAVYILQSDVSGAWIETQVSIPNEKLDMAVLTTASGLSGHAPLPLAVERTMRVSDTVYALGFPGMADAALDNGDELPSTAEDVTVTTGIVSKIKAMVYETEAFQTDCFISNGNSGGPMLNEDGAVIGINTWGSDGMNYIIHISYAIDVLTQYGIDFVAYDPTAPTEEPLETPDDTPAIAPVENGNAIAQYGWVLLIAVGGVGAALGFSRMKKVAAGAANDAQLPTPSAQQTPTMPAAPPPETTAHLVGTGGAFAGTTFPIRSVLSIGRDPLRCQIVFPDGAKGISALHCEVIAGPSGIRLVDKGSTYGTFLADGRKLAPNEGVALRKGDRFYLADSKNEFQVL